MSDEIETLAYNLWFIVSRIVLGVNKNYQANLSLLIGEDAIG